MTTRDTLEADARATALEATQNIRDQFQARRPHYAPPPWAKPGGAFWQRWREANIELHGIDGQFGCIERFPEAKFGTPDDRTYAASLADVPY